MFQIHRKIYYLDEKVLEFNFNEVYLEIMIYFSFAVSCNSKCKRFERIAIIFYTVNKNSLHFDIVFNYII